MVNFFFFLNYYFNKWCLNRGHLWFLLSCRSCAGWCSPAAAAAVPPRLSRLKSETGSHDRLSHVQEELVAFLSALHTAFVFITNPQGTAGERKSTQTRTFCKDPGCLLVSHCTFML